MLAAALPVRSFRRSRPVVALYSTFLPAMVTTSSTSENVSFCSPVLARSGGAAATARNAAARTRRRRAIMDTPLGWGRATGGGSVLLEASSLGNPGPVRNSLPATNASIASQRQADRVRQGLARVRDGGAIIVPEQGRHGRRPLVLPDRFVVLSFAQGRRVRAEDA